MSFRLPGNGVTVGQDIRGIYIYTYTYTHTHTVLSSGIQVQNVQVCYIGTHVPWWFAASINLSLHEVFLLMLSLP